jgi:hypothetical protein
VQIVGPLATWWSRPIDLDFRILVIAEGETRPPEPLVKWRQYQALRQVGVAERQGVAKAVHGD